jgi:nucleoside phosphorylase
VGGRDAIEGILAGARVLCFAVGDGAERAAEGLRAALRERPVAALVVVGVAGALTSDLSAGDVVVAREILVDGAPPRPTDPLLLAHAVRLPGLRAASLVSAPRLVADPDAKADLALRWRRTPATVDLESAALAEVAAEAGLPLAILRAVSDAADEALPRSLLAAERPGGSIDRGRLVARTVLRPWHVPGLLALRRRVRLCATALVPATEHLARGWAPAT